MLARRRLHEIDLELDAQDPDSLGHETQRRVPTGAVRDSRHNSRMQEAMLLGEVAAKGPFDDNMTRLDRDEACPNGSHECLTIEARLNARSDFRVCSVVHRFPSAMVCPATTESSSGEAASA